MSRWALTLCALCVLSCWAVGRADESEDVQKLLQLLKSEHRDKLLSSIQRAQDHSSVLDSVKKALTDAIGSHGMPVEHKTSNLEEDGRHISQHTESIISRVTSHHTRSTQVDNSVKELTRSLKESDEAVLGIGQSITEFHTVLEHVRQSSREMDEMYDMLEKDLSSAQYLARDLAGKSTRRFFWHGLILLQLYGVVVYAYVRRYRARSKFGRLAF